MAIPSYQFEPAVMRLAPALQGPCLPPSLCVGGWGVESEGRWGEGRCLLTAVPRKIAVRVVRKLGALNAAAIVRAEEVAGEGGGGLIGCRRLSKWAAGEGFIWSPKGGARAG